MDLAERFIGTVNYDLLGTVFVFFREYFINTVVDQFQFEFVEVDALRSLDLEDRFAFEHEVEAAGGAQRTARFVKVAADVGYRTGVVVGGGFNHDGDPVGTVAVVLDLFVVGVGIFRDGPLDGSFHVLFGHVFRLGSLDQHTQTRVARRVGTSGFDGDHDLFAQTGESSGHIAPALEFTRLAEFESSSHNSFRFSGKSVSVFYNCPKIKTVTNSNPDVNNNYFWVNDVLYYSPVSAYMEYPMAFWPIYVRNNEIEKQIIYLPLSNLENIIYYSCGVNVNKDEGIFYLPCINNGIDKTYYIYPIDFNSDDVLLEDNKITMTICHYPNRDVNLSESYRLSLYGNYEVIK